MPLVFDVSTEQPILEPAPEVGAVDEDVVELINASTPLGMWRTKYATGHVYFSPETCRIYGIEPTSGPVNLIEVNNRIHPEDLPYCLSLFENSAEEKTGFHYTLRIIDGKGGYKFVRSVGQHRYNADGSCEMIGIFHEVP
jgi:PAS domain-containing protein